MATPAVPDGGPAPSGRRAELLERLALAGRASSVATVMFHTAVGAASGLSATETKALEVITHRLAQPEGQWRPFGQERVLLA